MHYDSVFNYTVAHCFSTEFLLPSVYRTSTGVWMRSYSIFCFLRIVPHDIVQAVQWGRNYWWPYCFVLFSSRFSPQHKWPMFHEHSLQWPCLIRVLCWAHSWTGNTRALSVCLGRAALPSVSDSLISISYNSHSRCLTLNPSLRFFLPSCLALVLGVPKLFSHVSRYLITSS